MIDLKHVLVIANNGTFRGYQRFLGKSGQAANICRWYEDKNWFMIEQYIRKEAKDFVCTYSILQREIHKIAVIELRRDITEGILHSKKSDNDED